MGVELSANADEPVAGRDAWGRLAGLWHLLLAGTLALPTAITLLFGPLDVADRLVVAGLVVVFGVWHWALLGRAPLGEESTGTAVVYWVGTVALVGALAGYGDSYTILLYGLFPLGFITLNWWGMVPLVVLTALIGWRSGGWAAGPAAAISVAATALLAAVIAVVVGAVARQSEERRAALELLAATRAQLAASARRTGGLEERQRLARELHDTVAQGLASIVTHLEAADQAVSDRPDLVRSHLDIARRAARGGLDELRRTVQALRPDLLHGAPLPEALRRSAEQWSGEHAVPVEVRVTGEPTALHTDTETALLRVAQEALTNTARHAGASRVVLSLSYLGDTVTLDVDDDGIGFAGTPAPRPDGGFGLIGMRERVAAVGGHLAVESAPGEGTTVAASVPA
ncbi:sensor histidine kinase [Pseudonocardia humida]|uniref:Oxygen sensor histidine kinase NreB n=1 Tax=Pseudonocardia humida TaxID=2800819 RepID=A0ABT1A2X8_9PSEU|nr:sensor histidine kinase [Pseudonocardia humida]MCO1657321.1 sensor histidine kinase [Pseudonocardia humida]